jgi:hypothetical protein
VLGKAPYVYSGVGEEVGVETLVGRSRRPTRWHIWRSRLQAGVGAERVHEHRYRAVMEPNTAPERDHRTYRRSLPWTAMMKSDPRMLR